jgi:hypothetical protein
MITTSHIDENAIEQFKTDVAAQPGVERVSRKSGQKVVRVTVAKTDDGVPRPYKALGESNDKSEIVADDYVVTPLAGSGHSPGSQYVHRLAVSGVCDRCEQRPVESDRGLCRGCKYD